MATTIQGEEDAGDDYYYYYYDGTGVFLADLEWKLGLKVGVVSMVHKYSLWF